MEYIYEGKPIFRVSTPDKIIFQVKDGKITEHFFDEKIWSSLPEMSESIKCLDLDSLTEVLSRFDEKHHDLISMIIRQKLQEADDLLAKIRNS